MTPEQKKYLEQGGVLTNGNIPTQIAPTGSPTVPINSSLLEPVSQLPYVNPNPVPVPSITGLSTDVAQLTEPEVKATDLTSRLQELNKQLVGQSAFRTQQEDVAGIKELQKTQQDLANQLKAVQSEAQAIPLQLQTEATGRGITAGGLAPLQTARLRTNAIQALGVSAALEASKGNLTLAMDQVDRAVAAKFDPIKEKLAVESANLKLIMESPQYSLADKKRAASVLALKEQEKAKTEADAANAKLIYDTSLKASQLGGDALVIKAIQSAETPEEALAIATAYGLTAEKPKLEEVKLDDGRTVLYDPVTGDVVKDLGGAEATGGIGGVSSEMIAYAQQYAATGTIPPGLPKGTFGKVAEIAKELPKVEGEIIDNNTGIRPSKMSSTQIDAYAALRDLVKKTEDAKTLFSKLYTGAVGGTVGNIFPTETRNAYNTLRGEIVDLLSRARSGAAISANEEAMYLKKIPGTLNQFLFIGQSGESKLEGLKSSLEDKLDTGLKANGASMVGVTKVKVGGKEFTVGQTITNTAGQTGRVTADGRVIIQQ